MTERKWTPGPWIEHDGNVIDTSGYEVCWDATDRDAHLIAAAPDLYEALEMAADYLDYDRDPEAYMAVREALSKARGET